MSEESQSRVSRWFAEKIALINAVNQSVDEVEHDPLPDEERPTCPYCDRKLGVGALEWKCVQHGRFPTEEFEVNILRAMQADAEKTRGPSILDAIVVLPIGLFILFLSWLQRRVNPYA